ncbi:AIM24 family protein [Gephyromycinifex aptenodytis]|uniref:AIM24 family protein n=1 Tax=Gephyromycinifex aptenodytis TaxID=2716227 RepID=UPI001B2FFC6C|nr:AIM24 family protein [Gephyromycinifex aptenodytis]
MRSALFEEGNLEVSGGRFSLQNPQMLRVALGEDVLAVKGSMVAYQGAVTFAHEKSGSMGRLLKKVLTNEDLPLMRCQGQGEVFFAHEAGHVYLVELDGDGLTINGHSLLAFDAALDWDIKRVQGVGMFSGGLFNTVISGRGVVAVSAIGAPVVLDTSQQPTYVDIQSAVGWSSHLQPQVVSSMNMRSMLRGGTGEAFQYAFHGPGFVVVQPSEGPSLPSAGAGGSNRSGGGFLENLFE